MSLCPIRQPLQSYAPLAYKNTLHLIGLDDKRAIVLREKISRGQITARLANVPRCLIGIEAGMATHYAEHQDLG